MQRHNLQSPDLAIRARCAIAAAGGGAALARALGIRRSAVQAWKSSHIPVAQVPAVARLTGLGLDDLRPDVFDAPRPPTGAA